jgi:hypothetical protein
VSKDAVMAMTREIASKRALDYIDKAYAGLADVVERGQSEAARVAAATAILDRALGKPREAPPEPASDPAKDITPQGMNGSGHKPEISTPTTPLPRRCSILKGEAGRRFVTKSSQC